MFNYQLNTIEAIFWEVQQFNTIEAIFWEATSANLQGWITSPLLADIEFLMMKHVYIHIIDRKMAKIRYEKYYFMEHLIVSQWKKHCQKIFHDNLILIDDTFYHHCW